jgi:4-amino-4-deoxy-L-arabinose transferase-like glycosyltransferase
MKEEKLNYFELKNRSGIVFFILFVASAFLILIGLPLFQKGTFIDGVLYKTVAWNYANDQSTFWKMKFTDTCMDLFCEQPPLYFFMLGSFYKLLGTNYIVDRIFTFLLFILMMFMVRAVVVQRLSRPNYFTTLCALLLISIPVFCWSFVNQVIEPLVCFLTVISVYLFIRYLNTTRTFYSILFSGTVILLFLTKGFQSCFIIGLPVFYTLLSSPYKREWISWFTFAAIVASVGLYCIIRFYDPAAEWFSCYYNSRLLLTMRNTGSTTDYHAEIIVRFFTELIPCFIILILAFVMLKHKYQIRMKFAMHMFWADKLAVALLFTSLLGSLPYAISLVQRGFYLLPAFVCFIMSLVFGFKRYWLLIFSNVDQLTKHLASRLLIIILFICSLIYSLINFNHYKRDEALLSDVAAISPFLKTGEQLLVDSDMWNYFSLHGYLYMSKNVSLTQDSANTRYMVARKTDPQAEKNIQGLMTKEIDLVKLK